MKSETPPSSALRPSVLRLLPVLALLSTIAQSTAAVFTVTTTANSGQGSLRAGINFVNSNVVDTIEFSIPPFDGLVKTILLASALPVITNEVVIDGYTQDSASANTLTNGNNADLQIELRCTSVSKFNGLTVSGGSSFIRGLVLRGFDNAIVLQTGDFNFVEGNFIGLDASGLSIGAATNNTGVLVLSSVNRIGGYSTDTRNVISGNSFEGISIEAGADNDVLGNYIGTDRHGFDPVPNGSGIVLVGPAFENFIGDASDPVARNIISGNTGFGIVISDLGSWGNYIFGNYIGTDIFGTNALGNGNFGISINSSSNVIGGSLTDPGNVIVANGQGGIRLGASSIVSNNWIVGNLIGIGSDNRTALGNLGNGITLSRGDDTQFGSSFQDEGNVIAYNSASGISVGDQVLANRTKILNNQIFSNGLHGVITINSRNSLIGTNYVFGNAGIGIALRGISTSTNNRISANYIAFNGNVGIDLAVLNVFDGVTTNDNCDADAGAPNRTQNFPVLTLVTNTQTGVTINGFLNSAPSAEYLIEFFSNTECDPSGYGEGGTPIGRAYMFTESSCVGFFSVSFPFFLPACAFVTATATDSNGNTSEFSVCYPVGQSGACTPPPAGMLNWWSGDGTTTNLIAGGSSGTLSNGAAFATGKVGTAFSFDGTNDVFTVTNSSALQPNSFTLDAWVNFTATNGVRRMIMGKPVGTGSLNSYALYLENGALRGAIGTVSLTSSTLISTFAPSTGVWYHVTYTFDTATTNHALYVNGVLQRMAKATIAGPTYDTRSFLMGADANAGILGEFFAGQIDEAEIFNRALTPLEIQTLFCAGSFGKCKSPCTVTCPGDFTTNNAPGQCGQFVNYPQPTTSGDCPTIVLAPPPGAFFPVGTNIVTCSINSIVACTFKVIVLDTELPTITCPADIITSTATGLCAATVTFPNPLISDNCSATVVCVPPSGSAFPKGGTTVNCTATDPSGNQATCSFNVTVADTERPVISCSTNIVVTAAPGQTNAVVNFPAPMASDNCAVLTTNSVPPSGSSFPLGTNTVTCTALDTSGNTNSCQFLVIVNPPPTVLRFTDIRPEGNSIRVWWQTSGGTTNRVQSAATLTNPFTDLSPNILIPGTNSIITNYLDGGAVTSGPARFYRIRKLP